MTTFGPAHPRNGLQAAPTPPRASLLAMAAASVLGLAALVTVFVVFAWPAPQPVISPLRIASDSIPTPGDDPVEFLEGQFWLVNLLPGEGADLPSAFGVGGLLALFRLDSFRGCPISWSPQFLFEPSVGSRGFEQGQTGWFRDPCHGSVYTKAGVQVWGPSPRSMDTMRLDVTSNGTVLVFPEQLTAGDDKNPARAVLYDRPDS